MKHSFARTVSIITVTLLVSCSEQGTGNVTVLTLDHTAKDTTATLLPEDTGFNIPVCAHYIYVWEDSIAVVCNKHSPEWFLELYNISENRMLKHFLHRGNGPGEMLDVNFFFNNDTITIEDFQKDRIAVIPVQDAVCDDSYKPELRPLSVWSQYKLPYKGRLLALNPYCFVNKEYGINNDGFRFIITDSNYVYNESTSYRYDTFNVSYSQFFISYINDRIVFINKQEPMLEMYDLRFKLLKKVLGPEMPGKQKYSIEDDGEIIFTNTIPSAYTSYCCDENYFYVSYNGDYLSHQNNFDSSYLKTWIFKFDWNGNFVDSYYVDHFVSSMSLSSDGQSMYIFGVNRDGENLFYKTRLI